MRVRLNGEQHLFQLRSRELNGDLESADLVVDVYIILIFDHFSYRTQTK
jgi:hypothetical protein